MPKQKPIIVAIDAGHGMTTPGKRSPDGEFLEWGFNRNVADELESKLWKRGINNINTTPGPIAIPIWDRQNFVDKLGAKHRVVYISIHANAAGKNGWNDAKGAVVFHRIKASFETVQLAQSMYEEMDKLTIKMRHDVVVGRNLRNIATGRRKGKKRKPMRARLASVLVECGFMTNKRDVKYMSDPDYQWKIADAIANAISAFIEEVK